MHFLLSLTESIVCALDYSISGFLAADVKRGDDQSSMSTLVTEH